MSKELTVDDVAAHKKNAMRKLDNLLRKYIHSEDEKLLKKANLISYWLESFSNYVSFENRFDPTKLINYSRGDVIRLNFGFNIGKEFGGLHYAIVLDNDSKHHSEVITVVPLSSTEGKTVHERSVDLGSELYEKVSVMQNNLRSEAQKELEQTNHLLAAIQTAATLLDTQKEQLNRDELSDDFLDLVSQLIDSKPSVLKAQKNAQLRLNKINANDSEISKMKIGSMAVTNQITTVSKQRIYTPKRSEDFLYGISFSASAMSKINSKIKELYIFD